MTDERDGLPEGWVKTTLGDIADVMGGVTKDTKNQSVDDEEFPYLRVANVQRGYLDLTEMKTIRIPAEKTEQLLLSFGDILFNEGGDADKLGRGWIWEGQIERCSFQNHVFRARLKHESIQPKYISWWGNTQGLSFFLENAKQTTNLASINKSTLVQLPINLPPASEQIRITDKLDTLLARVAAGRERLERVPKLLKRFRQSVLSAAVSGELTREWRENNQCNDALSDLKRIEEFKHNWARESRTHNEANRVASYKYLEVPQSNNYSEIPHGWRRATLEQVLLMVVDCHNKTAPYSSSGYPLIRTTNIRYMSFNSKDLKFVDEATFLFWSRRARPESGDIIFTREAPMGEAAIIPNDVQFCLGQRTMLFKPAGNLSNMKYILYSIYSTEFTRQYGLGAVGSGVQHLRVGDVGNLELSYPPLAEQAEIVRRVEVLFAIADRFESKYAAALSSFDRLTPALLAKAFRGELVPQDPNDEPASVLLERIRAAREVEGGKRGRGRPAKAAAGSGDGADVKRHGHLPGANAQAGEEDAEPKRRGRPPKVREAVNEPDTQPVAVLETVAAGAAPRGRGRPPGAGIPQASSFEDALRKLEDQKLQRAQGSRQVSLFGTED